MDIGRARLGMMVAETFRKKRKMTSTTRAIARSRGTGPRRPSLGWIRTGRRGLLRLMEAGSCALKVGRIFFDRVDDLDGIGAGLTLDGQDDERSSLYHEATLSVWTLSMTRPSCSRRMATRSGRRR